MAVLRRDLPRELALFWVPAAVLSQRGSSPPDLLLLLGGSGPSIVGVAMDYWTQDRAGRIDYLRRAFSLRRIGPAWYAFILLHFANNFTFSFLYPIPETVHLYGTILTLILAVAIVAIWGSQTWACRKLWETAKGAGR